MRSIRALALNCTVVFTVIRQQRRLETTSLSKTLFGAVVAAGLAAFSVVNASAAIVCTGTVCWHTHSAYDYPPDARVLVHPDYWRWAEPAFQLA